MSFPENLKQLRKEHTITQEQLAEMLNVSRQTISKWESGSGYPEAEKLIQLAQFLETSLDWLLLDRVLPSSPTVKAAPLPFSGKIAIPSYDKTTLFTCSAVRTSQFLAPAKDEPRYILNGVIGHTFWGEKTVILGYYTLEEDIQKEIEAITKALAAGQSTYQLQFSADIEPVGFLEQPKLKKNL